MERSFRSCAKALWRMSVPVRWRMLVSVLAGTVRIAASLAFVWASKHLVDIATKMSDAPLMSGISIFAGILALQLCVVIFANWRDAYCEVKSRNILRLDTFAKVMRSRWDGRERFLSGDTVNRLEEDVRVVGDVLIARIPGVITTLLQLVAASAYLMILAPNLLWVLLILMFSAVLHLGTLVAVFVAFRKLIIDLIFEFFRMVSDLVHKKFIWEEMNAERRMIVMIILSTLCLAPFYIFKGWFEGIAEDSLRFRRSSHTVKDTFWRRKDTQYACVVSPYEIGRAHV